MIREELKSDGIVLPLKMLISIEGCSGQDILATVLLTDAQRIFNYAKQSRIDGTDCLHQPLDFANRTLIYPVSFNKLVLNISSG